jgi:hypothetical protein
LTPSKRKYHIVSAIFLIFLYAGEDLVMADDVVTPSNPPFMPVEEEELEEALIVRGIVPERFEECQCEDDFFFIVKLGFLWTTIIFGYEAQSTLLPWSVELNI